MPVETASALAVVISLVPVATANTAPIKHALVVSPPWFPEWEHGGTPWENPEGYTKLHPIDFVKNWKTPTLVVHRGQDFRVVDTHGISVFTALQRKGIPSRLLYFPDENHWVLKPHTSIQWHDTVFEWLDRRTRQPAAQKNA